MKRPLLAAALGVLAAFGGHARAQYYPPLNGPAVGPSSAVVRPPVVSPLLDLRRGSMLNGTTGTFRNTPALNYFLGTRPEFDRLTNQAQVSRDLRALELGALAPANPEETAD